MEPQPSMQITKAITIRQPFAWLIVQGIKPVENRSWETKFRGPLAIHSAKAAMGDEVYAKCCKKLGKKIRARLLLGHTFWRRLNVGR